ncbi:hypothetical protein NESM_000775600 [Novymonas esmeraldas]|uniref:Uncharacterized protein n=1 Tax=Novymonas esmeraldas TaxID=1808958 RepID=A0AAW0EWQ2_9TRYP
MPSSHVSLHSPFDEASIHSPAEIQAGELVAVVPLPQSTATEATSPDATVTATAECDVCTGRSEPPPLDVRILPLLYLVTFWCGLAVVYAFLAYLMALSATWRGPVIVWASLLPTAVFSMWRRLPSEKARIQARSDVLVLLRCGGFYELAEPSSSGVATETELTPESQGERQPPPQLMMLTDAPTTDGGATSDTIVVRL